MSGEPSPALRDRTLRTDGAAPLRDFLRTEAGSAGVLVAAIVAALLWANIDPQWFREDLMRHVHAARVAQDVESADLSGVSGTPTFFINGQRHYDVPTLAAAIKTARTRAAIGDRDA